MTKPRLFCLIGFLCCSTALGQATSQPTYPMEKKRPHAAPLVRTSPPMQLHWDLSDQVHDVVAVFPHPMLSNETVVATDGGLLLSTDGGRTFNALPQGTADHIGAVTSVAFDLEDPRKFFIATSDHGLWVTQDDGKTIEQLATKASGLAADSVQTIMIDPTDPFRRTLLALHGIDALGLSVSNDAGKTWQIIFPDQHLLQIFFVSRRSREILLSAAPANNTDVHTLYYLPSLLEPWAKLMEDVTPVGAASPVGERGNVIFIATADKGILRIAQQGGIVLNVGPTDEQEWSSFGSTYWPTDDQQIFYAYQPKHLGMVLFTAAQLQGVKPDDPNAPPSTTPPPPESQAPMYATASEGLFTGALVMDGAQIRANSSGTTFFAAVNKTLYRSNLVTGDLCVTDVNVSPPVLTIEPQHVRDLQSKLASDLDAVADSHQVRQMAETARPKLDADLQALAIQRFTVVATVKATTRPSDVTVDLSRLNLSSKAMMYDDGKHGDGAAGDGVYANTFGVDFSALRLNTDDGKESIPGPVGLTVSAVSGQGASQGLSSAVGKLSLYTRPSAVPFVADVAAVKITGKVVGERKRLKSGKMEETIVVKEAGPWSAYFNRRDITDMTGEAYFSFYIRSPVETTDEITVQIGDHPTYSIPALTSPVPLLAEGFVPDHKIPHADIRVLIPISRLLKNAGDFQPSLAGKLVISGTATKPFDLVIHDFSFVPAAYAGDDASGGDR